MSKYVKIFLLAMFVVTLLVTTAMAGTTRVNMASVNGAAVNAAWEAMNQGRAINVSSVNNLNSGSNTVNVSYTYTQQLLANTQYVLKVDLNGASFNGNAAVQVCALNNAGVAVANTVAVATPGAASTYNFNINTGGINLPQGGYFVLTNAGCQNNAAPNLALTLNSTSSTGSATITMELLQGGQSIDASSTATIANIMNEFVPEVNNSTHTIDYLGVPGNGTRVINNAGASNVKADGLAAGVNNLSILRHNVDFSTTGTYGLNTNNSSISLTDTAGWQGISKVYIMRRAQEATCASANAQTSAISNNPSGTVALRIGGAGNYPGNAGARNDFFLCVEANGNDPLQTRNIRASVTIATSGQSQGSTAYSNIMTFNTNAYQGILPWAVSASHVKTYCLINNTGTSAANVVFDLMSKETIAATLSNVAVTQVAAGVSKLIIFDDGKITDEAGSTLATLTGLSSNNRYAGRITVTTGGNQAIMSCIQTDPLTGVKRSVPVLTNFNNTNWQQ